MISSSYVLLAATFFVSLVPAFAFQRSDDGNNPSIEIQPDTLPDQSLKTWVELAGYGSSTSRTPFWLHANQWGIVPISGQVVSLRAGVEARSFFSKDSLSEPKWSMTYGAELVANGAQHSKFLFPQAYAGVAFKSFQLTIGRRKQCVSFNDYELGSGAYMWSGNALPVPRIQLGFENYVPLIKNFVYFKGFYSDGFLDGKRPVTSELKLHNKSLFIRLGRPNGTVQLHGGFNHAVQWGGRSPYLTENGQMPKGIDKYWYVITGFKPGRNVKGISTFDKTNRIGNHVASLDAGIELNFANINIMLYRQSVVEDGSLLYLNNIKDGLNGITFRMKHQKERNLTVDKATFEFLYTKSQGGSEANAGNGIRGKDDYFNNAQVRDGWQYYGRAIGTPFITPQSENQWPRYADFFTNNNRVWVLHSGLQGKIKETTWVTKLSLSNNEGTYDQKLPKKMYQFSGIIALEKPLKWLGGSVIKGAVSVDAGKFLGDVIGGMLSFRKNIAF
ncbi:capsule assembly Wzi family protein [Dyadobacter psychrophilus]|uniref:Capsule assembly protein Wzi n=1 Tax=Dyadobacter psychrophilus TaxID=651661 RepID=A0A1T5HDZ8_9BACT|nr:capsule assembly Wzi family protein [Dyadobacter psychrophilus]SKC18874.1 Capsule assembly protein Wzi [Dyadobacter psychrophilus]